MLPFAGGRHTYSGSYLVNVETVLYQNGDIKFNYGAAHTGLSPTIGVSNGDNIHYTFSSRDNATTIPANVSSLMTYSNFLPTGLSLSPAGVISGTPTSAIGGYDFTVKVTDSASPQNIADKSFHLEVVNLPPLIVTIPADATEGVGTVTGSVSIPIALSTDLAVNLTSDNPGRVTVPTSVTILAGLTSADFDLTIVDNSLLDGLEGVIITASAIDYLPGSGSLTVHDNETATLTVSLPASAGG